MTTFTVNKAVRLTARRKALFDAMRFYAKKLRIHNYDVTICLNFKHGYSELFSAYAQTYHVDTNNVSIEFDASLPDCISQRVLAHEMVHVKQYITGELSVSKDGFQLWKGKTVNDGISYTREPWEREAMRKETIMMYDYFDFLGKQL